MTRPTSHPTKIPESSDTETLRHFYHARSESELRLFVSFPIVSNVAVRARHPEVTVDHLHSGHLLVLCLGALDDRQCYQDHGNESAHGIIIIKSATAGLGLSKLWQGAGDLFSCSDSTVYIAVPGGRGPGSDVRAAAPGGWIRPDACLAPWVELRAPSSHPIW
jgi:hypothetical protein